MTAESAQPGKASNVGFPVLWVGSGDGFSSRDACHEYVG